MVNLCVGVHLKVIEAGGKGKGEILGHQAEDVLTK